MRRARLQVLTTFQAKYTNLLTAAVDISAGGLHCVDAALLSAEDIYDAQKYVADLNKEQKRQFCSTAFIGGALTTGYPGHHMLCKTCFCKYHGIGLATFKRIVKDTKGGRRSWEHGHKGMKKPGQSYNHALAWTEEYAKRFGDQMPDDDTVHLPDYKWRSLYRRLENEMVGARVPFPSYDSWYAMVRTKLPHLRIRKYKRFSKCNVCSHLDMKIQKETGAARRKWEDVKNDHNNWQMRERAKYSKHRKKSLMSWEGKSKCLTLSIDTMDNSKTGLPGFARDPKEADNVGRLHTHVTGVICHGVGQKKCHLYTWFDRFPSGSDVVNTIIPDVISRLKGPLPPTLHLQMDNCWRENKNRYFGYD